MPAHDAGSVRVQPALFPVIVLWLMALGFLGFGLAFTLWPLPMAGVIEIPLPTPTARIDFAATYGGFEIGVAAFLIACARRADWLPTEQDREYVRSLMKPVYEPGKFAAWIAPPQKGVKGKPIDYEYVKFANSPYTR